MSKKTYIAVAEILRNNVKDWGLRRELAIDFASMFRADNPRFDAARFYAACGVDTE